MIILVLFLLLGAEFTRAENQPNICLVDKSRDQTLMTAKKYAHGLNAIATFGGMTVAGVTMGTLICFSRKLLTPTERENWIFRALCANIVFAILAVVWLQDLFHALQLSEVKGYSDLNSDAKIVEK